MKALAAALVAAQAEMPAVKPDARNPHFNSEFVTLDHLIAKTKPVLTSHGLTIVQQLSTSDAGAPALTTTLLHTSGEQLSSTLPLPLVTDMQKLGAAITYGRRYAWASVLGICDETDDDGNQASRASVVPSTRAGAGGSPSVAARDSGGEASKGGAAGGTNGAPPTNDWTFPFGKHKGKPISAVPDDYLDWVLAQDGKFEDIKERINAHRLGADEVPGGHWLDDEAEGIPF